MDKKSLFKKTYGGDPVVYRAPGRINLIGEHTDYNEGYVFPGSIHLGLDFLVCPSDRDQFNFTSLTYAEEDSCDIHGRGFSKRWSVYFQRAIELLNSEGMPLRPLSVMFGGDLPSGAGLSSSSAITCALIYILNEWSGGELSLREMTNLAGLAEKGAGLQGGLMDQYTIFHGVRDHLLLLDCRNLQHEEILFQPELYELVLADTNVKHNLVDSEYNTRAGECRQAVSILSSADPSINSLRDMRDTSLLSEFDLPEVLHSRVSFVVEENTRVIRAAEIIRQRDYPALGTLLYESHAGLRDLYEVSCDELDFIVEWSMKWDEILGSRMMGGGFGGTTIHLVEKGAFDSLAHDLAKKYYGKFGLKPSFHKVELSDGLRRID